MKPAWYPRLMTRSEQIIEEEQDGREEVMSTTAKCGHDKSLDDHCIVCEATFRVQDSLRAENAQLKEGLIQAVEQLEADYVYTPLDGHGALIRKLRAAIAKAEGKNQK